MFQESCPFLYDEYAMKNWTSIIEHTVVYKYQAILNVLLDLNPFSFNYDLKKIRFKYHVFL